MEAHMLTDSVVLDLLTAAGVSSITVNGTGVVYSQSIVIPRGSAYGLEYQFSSPGTINVKIEVQHGNQAPSTEGAADTAFVTGDNVNPVATASDANHHFAEVVPIACAVIRFRLTGQGMNDAATAVTKLKLCYSKNL